MPERPPIKLAPSILAADFARLGEEVAAVVEAGADYIHVDVMDGQFVSNLTFGWRTVEAIKPRAGGVPLDVHLMVRDPDRFLQNFARAGADILTVHVEAYPHPHRTIRRIRELGLRAGLALNPDTTLAAVEDLLPDLDLVLEPTLKLRSWRQFNDLPTGPAMWSLAQQEAFIRQIFKLKFNSIYLCMWPQHPFVDYEVKGIQRQSSCLLFGQEIPIDDDTIGREHLPDAPFLNNPDMLGAVTFNEKLEAGQRLADGVLRQAKYFEMHTSIHIQPLEFPAEFRSLLQTSTEEGIQLGSLTCAERGNLMNPDHVALIEAIISACLERWGRWMRSTWGCPNTRM